MDRRVRLRHHTDARDTAFAAILASLDEPSARRRAGLLAFLRDAFPFYERHGDLKMQLDEPALLIEMVVNSDRDAYDQDQARVEPDPEMP